VQLPCSFAYGEGVQKDMDEALRLFKVAIEHGSVGALNNLACFSVNRSFDESLKLFKLAVDKGYTYALCNLGVIFRDGIYVEQNLVKALILFETAMDQGDEYGKYFKSNLLREYELFVMPYIVARERARKSCLCLMWIGK
jgi:uncharacterized protein